MSGTESSPARKERPEETAITPLNRIAEADIGAASNAVDDWLRSFSGNYVTLDRVTMVLGSLPVTGNVMALVDLFFDIIKIAENKAGEGIEKFMTWTSVGVNLIGLVPFPPHMAAGRMTLRTSLHALRDQLRMHRGGIRASLITLLERNLNAAIGGELETLIEKSIGLLRDLLAECANLSDGIMDALVGALKRVTGETAVFATAPTPETNTRDPQTQSTLGRLWGAALDMGKRSINSVGKAASSFLPDEARQKIARIVSALQSLKTSFRAQLTDLADPAREHGIMWLLQMLLQALQGFRSGRKRTGQVNGKQGAEVTALHGGPAVDQVRVQAPARGQAGCKNCPAPRGSVGSIDFVFGTESISHTDFVLAAALPIEFTRTYRSNLAAMDDGPFGARWITPCTVRVDHTIAGRSHREGQLSFIYRGADGRSHAYPVLQVGQSHHDAIEKSACTA